MSQAVLHGGHADQPAKGEQGDLPAQGQIQGRKWLTQQQAEQPTEQRAADETDQRLARQRHPVGGASGEVVEAEGEAGGKRQPVVRAGRVQRFVRDAEGQADAEHRQPQGEQPCAAEAFAQQQPAADHRPDWRQVEQQHHPHHVALGQGGNQGGGGPSTAQAHGEHLAILARPLAALLPEHRQRQQAEQRIGQQHQRHAGQAAGREELQGQPAQAPHDGAADQHALWHRAFHAPIQEPPLGPSSCPVK